MPALGGDRALELAAHGLDAPGADAAEVLLTRSDVALTRFAESRIHQNVARVDGEARVRVVVDGCRVGVAATNDLTPDGLREASRTASALARLAPPDPDFGGLAGPASYGEAGVDDAPTAAATPAERAGIVRGMLGALARDMVAAGAVETGQGELVVVNTLGVRAYHRSTVAAASVLVSGPDSTGYAEDSGGRLGAIDTGALAARAVAKAELGRAPRALAPGTYAVVLEPAATGTLVQFLGWMAFGARAVREGRSPLSGRIGEQVCDPKVTIADDALSPLLPGVPFDMEGVPKRRVELIRDGVAAGVVHDRRSARAESTESTGHALTQPSPYSPLPTHLVMEPGTATDEELVAGCERGLLVTRFHYTNVVHPIEATITGMTRDGTFLVEDGRITGAVHNLRFTQSILGALGRVEQVGGTTEVATELFFGSSRAPAVRLGAFTFSSATSF